MTLAERIRLQEAIQAILPPGWTVRPVLMDPHSLECFHRGEAGGGVHIRWCRQVAVVGPSKDAAGRSLGPCLERIELGEFKGRRGCTRIVGAVAQAIDVFNKRWPSAAPKG